MASGRRRRPISASRSASSPFRRPRFSPAFRNGRPSGTPCTSTELAATRRAYVLRRMHETGAIDDARVPNGARRAHRRQRVRCPEAARRALPRRDGASGDDPALRLRGADGGPQGDDDDRQPAASRGQSRDAREPHGLRRAPRLSRAARACGASGRRRECGSAARAHGARRGGAARAARRLSAAARLRERDRARRGRRRRASVFRRSRRGSDRPRRRRVGGAVHQRRSSRRKADDGRRSSRARRRRALPAHCGRRMAARAASRSAGCVRLGRSVRRRDRRVERRLRFLPEQLQPRHAGAAAAGLLVQAVRVLGRARERLHAGDGRARRAGRRRLPGVARARLAARELRRQVFRSVAVARGSHRFDELRIDSHTAEHGQFRQRSAT